MGRLWWGYGDERAVGDAVPPFRQNSEEPGISPQVPHSQQVTRPTWGQHRDSSRVPPGQHQRRGRNAAEAELCGCCGSAAIAIGYAISRTEDTQFFEPNRLWSPGRLIGDSTDTHRR